jgi:hypothetical protein
VVTVGWSVRWGSAGIGHHLPLLGLLGPAGAVGSVGVAAVGPAGALVGQPVAAVGAADDGLGAGGGLAGAAFAVQLDHYLSAEGGVLLVAADPLVEFAR